MTAITDNAACDICCAPGTAIEQTRLSYAFLCASCGEQYGEYLLRTTEPLEATCRTLAQCAIRLSQPSAAPKEVSNYDNA
jgi:hypothetical protein